VKYNHLSTEERCQIAAMRGQYLGMAVIAQHLGRYRSTLYRAVKRNRSVHDGNYRATHSVWKVGGRKKAISAHLRFGKEAFAPIEIIVRGELSFCRPFGLMGLMVPSVRGGRSGPRN